MLRCSLTGRATSSCTVLKAASVNLWRGQFGGKQKQKNKTKQTNKKTKTKKKKKQHKVVM